MTSNPSSTYRQYSRENLDDWVQDVLNSPNFDYRQHSLENLGNWVHDVLNNESLSAQDIYDTIIKCVDESIEYHRKELTKSVELSSLLKGNRKNSFDDPYISSAADRPWHPYHYDGWDGLGGWDGYDDFESPLPTQHTEEEPNAKCDKDSTNFWEENYYPEESHQYTEEELGAMCDKAASDQEKDQCREYNLREAEYYDNSAESQKSKYYWETDRNKEFTEDQHYGWILNENGKWIKNYRKLQAHNEHLPL